MIGSVLEIFGIGLIPVYVGILANPDKVFEKPILGNLLNTFGISDFNSMLIWGGVTLILVFLLKNGFIALNHYMQARFTKTQLVTLSKRMFSIYMYAPYDFHLNRNSAELLRNINAETSYVISQVLSPFLRGLMSGTMTFAIIVFLLANDPLISIVIFCLFALIGTVYNKLIQKKIIAYSLSEQKYRNIQVKAIYEGLNVIKEVRILNREKYFIKHFTQSTMERAKAIQYKEVVSKLFSPLIEFVAAFEPIVPILNSEAVGDCVLINSPPKETKLPSTYNKGVVPSKVPAT